MHPLPQLPLTLLPFLPSTASLGLISQPSARSPDPQAPSECHLHLQTATRPYPSPKDATPPVGPRLPASQHRGLLVPHHCPRLLSPSYPSLSQAPPSPGHTLLLAGDFRPWITVAPSSVTPNRIPGDRNAHGLDRPSSLASGILGPSPSMILPPPDLSHPLPGSGVTSGPQQPAWHRG